MNKSYLLAIGLAAMSLTACKKGAESTENTSTFHLGSNMDSTVNMHDDFYRYAVGGWMKKNPIPGTEYAWGSFNEVTERNKALLHSILEESAKANGKKGSNTQKIGDFYKTGMDSVKLNADGIKPLAPYFAEIDAISDKKGLVELLAKWQSRGLGVVYGMWVGQDEKNATQMIPTIWQGGLSLPDKDYYFKPDFAKTRAAFVKHVTNMFVLAGEKPEAAAQKADVVMKLETQLAKSSMDRISMRDPYKLYNKKAVSQISQLTSEIDWTTHTAAIGLPKTDSIIVAQPEYLKGLNEAIKTVPIDNWKTYLRYQMMQTAGPYLSDNIGDELFSFFSKELNGTKIRKTRWERVMRTIDENIGEALGELYVQKAFTKEAKERMLKMVKSLQDVFRERIQKLDWMSPETKTKATAKLDKFMVKIGYPDKWRDYSGLEISTNSYLENIMKAGEFEYKRMINKLGKPVDRTEWGMSPQTVNAYYNPNMNEIVFPAGILQPPFFDLNADDAMIYGAIGAVIGHEMTHGFDDQGRQYDAEGNLKDWWTKADAEQFQKKADGVIKQFDGYTILDSVHVQGKLTLGENLADLGGLSIAYDAFKRTAQGKSTEKIDGFTGDQRFFMSWANAWKNNTTPEAMKQQIFTDPHSPEEWRCNGPVSHMDAFYQAFGIKETGKMFRKKEERIVIW